MRLLAIVGSPRPAGNTDYLVDEALAEASKLGAEVEKIVLSQYKVAPCLGHDDCASFDHCFQQDDTGWILDRFCKAAGVILATPVYYYNVSAQMKAFMDRNYFLYTHKRTCQAKTVGIMVVAEAEGIEDTLHTLKRFIGESFSVKESRTFTVCGLASRLGEAKDNLSLVKEAKRLGRQMVLSLKEAH